MKKQILNGFLMVFLTMIISSGFSVIAQSINKSKPVPVTSRVMKGTVSGKAVYWYSLRVRRGTLVTVNIKATLTQGSSFVVNFHGKLNSNGFVTQCCQGDTYFQFNSSGANEAEKSFTITTDGELLMVLDFNTKNVGYTITFDGFEFGDDSGDTKTPPVVPPAKNSDPADITDWFVDRNWCSNSNATLYSADFNGDNRTDLFCREPQRISIDYADANGQFGGTDWSLDTNWCTHANAKFSLGDFNGDNRTDLLCKDPNRIWISYADANGQF